MSSTSAVDNGAWIEDDGAWLVGRFDNPQVFHPIRHEVVRVGHIWHSAIDVAEVTVCGLAVPAGALRHTEIFTACHECGATLHADGHAVWLPWTLVSEMLGAYWTREAEGREVTA